MGDSRAVSSRYTVALLFGAPGTGKGTQGAMLGACPGVVHISMGDIFRDLPPGSGMGREFASYSSRGLLVPDEFTVRLFESYAGGLEAHGGIRRESDILLLDGLPRTPEQAELLKAFVDVVWIFHLHVEDTDDLVQRLLGRNEGRPDDGDPDVIRRRIEVYDSETAPTLASYTDGMVQHVDAARPPLQVLADVASGLAACSHPGWLGAMRHCMKHAAGWDEKAWYAQCGPAAMGGNP